MTENENEEISPEVESLNPKDKTNKLDNLSIEETIKEIMKNKKGCYFPSAHLILLILEVFIFILTYIIPKGKYDCIIYDPDKDIFIRYIYNKTAQPTEKILNATQETLDELKIKINIENFKNGYVKQDVAIPHTYKVLKEVEQIKFIKLFTYPILGLIDSADIAFFLMMIVGCLYLLIEMKSFTSAMEALSSCGKNGGIILLIVVYFILSIGGSALGFEEEILSFYPALMPFYIRNGIDGALSAASIYFGSIVGNMFSTFNPFGTVIGSYLAGVNFMDGIAFRIVAFFVGDAVVIGYFIYYHRTVSLHPEKSVVYEIQEEIRNKVLKDEEENERTMEGNKKEYEYNINDVVNNEDQKLKEPKSKNIEFTWIQKISLILFALTFIIMIIGVTVLQWWFVEMGTVFFLLGIILIILARRGEKEGIEIFAKGAGDFTGVILIIGLARGINITLDQGLIEDTVLNALSNIVEHMTKVGFAVIIFLIYIVLGFFVQNGTGLAVLSIPVFAPLCDQINVSKNVLVNAFMYGQNMIEFVSPTGLSLIVSQIIGMKYIHWLKFVWKVMIPLFILLIILVILDSIIE